MYKNAHSSVVTGKKEMAIQRILRYAECYAADKGIKQIQRSDIKFSKGDCLIKQITE